MKVALAQVNFHVGNFDSNFEKIQAKIHEAKTAKADIIVFPELAVTGYPPRDFLEFESFIDQCEKTLDQVKDLSQDIGIIIGSPRRNEGKGKRLFNSAFFFYNKCRAFFPRPREGLDAAVVPGVFKPDAPCFKFRFKVHFYFCFRFGVCRGWRGGLILGAPSGFLGRWRRRRRRRRRLGRGWVCCVGFCILCRFRCR